MSTIPPPVTEYVPTCGVPLPTDATNRWFCELPKRHSGFHLCSIYWGPVDSPLPDYREANDA